MFHVKPDPQIGAGGPPTRGVKEVATPDGADDPEPDPERDFETVQTTQGLENCLK